MDPIKRRVLTGVLLIAVLIFAVELLIMEVLPGLLPVESSTALRWLDPIVLVLAIAPFLHLLVIRPLLEHSEELLRAKEAERRFLSNVSHEIRTPLNAILGMAQLMEIESPTPSQLDRLRRIEEASNLLLGIINDVLDFSKMEAGRIQLVREAFTLDDLLARSMGIVSERAQLKQLKLTTAVAPGTPQHLLGDMRRIEQILVNLLSNAIKFTNEGGVSIDVSAAGASDNRVVLRFAVKDTGMGIAEEDIAKLFTPFRQLEQGMARRFGGTGLGLSISRQLARAMHGDCVVQSQLGQGSTFTVTVQVENDLNGDKVSALPMGMTPQRENKIGRAHV